jgi:predicted XRE-type DNA-binding protein
MKKEKIVFTKSTGNIFKDLGFANSEEMLAKAKLASGINEILQMRNLTQKEAALILEISQSNISLLSRGILEGFSLERLMRFFNKLNQDIDIVIHIKPKNSTSQKYGHMRVMYA